MGVKLQTPRGPSSPLLHPSGPTFSHFPSGPQAQCTHTLSLITHHKPPFPTISEVLLTISPGKFQTRPTSQEWQEIGFKMPNAHASGEFHWTHRDLTRFHMGIRSANDTRSGRGMRLVESEADRNADQD